MANAPYDRLPEDFDDKTDLYRPLFPLPRRIRLIVACVIVGPVLVGILAALVYEWS